MLPDLAEKSEGRGNLRQSTGRFRAPQEGDYAQASLQQPLEVGLAARRLSSGKERASLAWSWNSPGRNARGMNRALNRSNAWPVRALS